MEKFLILGPDQGKYKHSLEHLVVLESKKLMKGEKEEERGMGQCGKGTKWEAKRVPMAKAGII